MHTFSFSLNSFKLRIRIKAQRLKWSILFFAKILFFHLQPNKNNKFFFDVVLSMASYPRRIKYIQYTLYSLFFQSIAFKKLYICLSKDDFPSRKIPIRLQLVICAINTCYNDSVIEILWTDDLKSYKKLVPLLRSNIDFKTIITVDDDVFYPSNWLLSMRETHLAFPTCICSHYAYKASTNLPYTSWEELTTECFPDYWNYSVGVGGTLYPHSCFYHDVTLYPNGVINDDLYFWFMAVINHTKTVLVKNHCGHPIPTILENETPCLWKQHATTGENDRCLALLRKKYPQFDSIVGISK